MSYLSFVFSLFSFQGAFQAIKAWFKHLSFKCLNHSLIKVRSKSEEVRSDVSAPPTYLKCSLCEHLTYYLLLITYYLKFFRRKNLVGQSGLEPPTSRLSVVCSNQLSYWPVSWEFLLSRLVEISGIEPLTSCLQSRRSPSWAKPPYLKVRSNK